MGTGLVLSTQIVSRNKMLLYITQRDGYKMGSETLELSNVSQRMGFRVSLDTTYWVKYWFLEPNKNGFCTTKTFQLPPGMGFKVNVDAKDWKKVLVSRTQ